jgi:hypothetical protein
MEALLPPSELAQRLPLELDRWTDPALGLLTLRHVAVLSPGASAAGSPARPDAAPEPLLLAHVAGLAGGGGDLLVSRFRSVDPGSPSSTGPLWRPVRFADSAADASGKQWPGDGIERVWTSAAAPGSAAVLCDGSVWLVRFGVPQAVGSGVRDGRVRASRARALRLPAGLLASGELDCALLPGGGLAAAGWEARGADAADAADADAGSAPAPVVLPAPPAETVLVAYAPDTGWIDVCRVGPHPESLRLSADGRRAVWRCMLSGVPEEAERGDFFGADVEAARRACRRGLSADARALPPARRLTRGAGRVDWAEPSPCGRFVLLCANFSRRRPITTHRSLFVAAFPDGRDEGASAGAGHLARAAVADAGEGARPTPPRLAVAADGRSIESFGWAQAPARAGCPDDALGAGGLRVWAAMIRGVRRESRVFAFDGSASAEAPPLVPWAAWSSDLPAAGSAPARPTIAMRGGRDGAVVAVYPTEGSERFPGVCVVSWPSGDGSSAATEGKPAVVRLPLPHPEGFEARGRRRPWIFFVLRLS